MRIVALGYALMESVSRMVDENKKLRSLIKLTIDGLRSTIPDIVINAENVERLPGTINVTFPLASGEAIMQLLDLKGICVSTSSACNSGNDAPSHVLLAMGLTERQAKSSIRISYGRYNSEFEAVKIVEVISNAYDKIVSSL